MNILDLAAFVRPARCGASTRTLVLSGAADRTDTARALSGEGRSLSGCTGAVKTWRRRAYRGPFGSLRPALGL